MLLEMMMIMMEVVAVVMIRVDRNYIDEKNMMMEVVITMTKTMMMETADDGRSDSESP